MKSDIWKNIKGYVNYFVSNKGQVRRMDCIRNGHLKIGRYLKQGTLKSRYPNVRINGKSLLTHRLVAYAFIPNPDNKPFINHIDGNKLNNNVSNLEWCTPYENVQHANLTGLSNYRKGFHGDWKPIAETVKKLYLYENKTIEEIRCITKKSNTTIYNYLKELGIELNRIKTDTKN